MLQTDFKKKGPILKLFFQNHKDLLIKANYIVKKKANYIVKKLP